MEEVPASITNLTYVLCFLAPLEGKLPVNDDYFVAPLRKSLRISNEQDTGHFLVA
jgi:hypothetical protein